MTLKAPNPTEAQVSAGFFRALASQAWAVHVQIPRAKIPRKASAAVRRAADRSRVEWYERIARSVAEIPACLAFWRSNTGAGQIGSGGRYVEFGLWGQPDIEGVFSPLGLRVGIEIKRRTTRLLAHQSAHRDLLVGAGAVHLVVRDPWEGVAELEAILSERLGAPISGA